MLCLSFFILLMIFVCGRTVSFQYFYHVKIYNTSQQLKNQLHISYFQCLQESRKNFHLKLGNILKSLQEQDELYLVEHIKSLQSFQKKIDLEEEKILRVQLNLLDQEGFWNQMLKFELMQASKALKKSVDLVIKGFSVRLGYIRFFKTGLFNAFYKLFLHNFNDYFIKNEISAFVTEFMKKIVVSIQTIRLIIIQDEPMCSNFGNNVMVHNKQIITCIPHIFQGSEKHITLKILHKERIDFVNSENNLLNKTEEFYEKSSLEIIEPYKRLLILEGFFLRVKIHQKYVQTLTNK